MNTQHITLPFTCRKQRGKVDITLQANKDPDHAWGLDLIFSHIPPNAFPKDFHGFPVLSAKVVYPHPANETSGYGSLFGWIQLIKADKKGREGDWEIDVFPWAKGLGSPFSYWGFCPTAFDAPAMLSDEQDYWTRWRAQTFLCVLVDAGLSKKVVPVGGAGFSWGFDIKTEESEMDGLKALERNIVIKNVEVINLEGEWSERVQSLRAWYPEWEFLDASASL